MVTISFTNKEAERVRDGMIWLARVAYDEKIVEANTAIAVKVAQAIAKP